MADTTNTPTKNPKTGAGFAAGFKKGSLVGKLTMAEWMLNLLYAGTIFLVLGLQVYIPAFSSVETNVNIAVAVFMFVLQVAVLWLWSSQESKADYFGDLLCTAAPLAVLLWLLARGVESVPALVSPENYSQYMTWWQQTWLIHLVGTAGAMAIVVIVPLLRSEHARKKRIKKAGVKT